jgi:GNAT superfamily N-acetyltransferase
MLHVRPATTSDLKLILNMIDEAAGWLRAKATDQWEKPWPSQEERDERVRRGLETGRTWVVEDNGIPVATITCEPDAGLAGWTKPEQAEPAVYVSRLVVSRGHAGQGIGAELINWAGRWAGRQYGARWIRIDVWTSNIALHQYFENLGFWFVRFGVMSSPSAALFQKQTATISSTSTPRLMEQPRLIKPSPRSAGDVRASETHRRVWGLCRTGR